MKKYADRKKLEKALTAWAEWYVLKQEERAMTGDSSVYDGYGFEQELFEALGCTTVPVVLKFEDEPDYDDYDM